MLIKFKTFHQIRSLYISHTEANIISTHYLPPPNVVFVSLTVDVNTQRASWRDLSASPMICSVAPRKTMEQASPNGTPL